MVGWFCPVFYVPGVACLLVYVLGAVVSDGWGGQVVRWFDVSFCV